MPRDAQAPAVQLCAPDPVPPCLGTQVLVQPGEGRTLRNPDTGLPYPAGTPTPALVTPTLLRRLADGDLLLA